MATNPMQRRSRNSFLLGMLVMLLIAGIIIGGLVYLLINEKKANQEQEQSLVDVYVLSRDVKSGTEISNADVITNVADIALRPSSAIDLADLNSVVAKIDLKAGTILTKEMLTTVDDTVYNDLRVQEFNMFSLPIKLNVDDYIDVRLTLPNGLEYVVLSKKRVLDIIENTIWLKVSEEEMLTISNAIVETYKMTGAKLSINSYVEPGMQEAATPTYVVSQEVYNLIQSEPNIVDTAKRALTAKYNANSLSNQRQNINSALNDYAEQAQSNLEQKVQEETEARKQLREKYLEQLTQQTTISN